MGAVASLAISRLYDGFRDQDDVFAARKAPGWANTTHDLTLIISIAG